MLLVTELVMVMQQLLPEVELHHIPIPGMTPDYKQSQMPLDCVQVHTMLPLRMQMAVLLQQARI